MFKTELTRVDTNLMASTAFTWDKVGPRLDERRLAGRVAGALWLTVPPMVCISLVLPGRHGSHSLLLALITVPALAWGLACLVAIDWDAVRSPLVFHLPATLALPYIAGLVSLSGAEQSPFSLTLLMLLAFCSYFFTPQAAVPYLVGSVVVLGFPLLYSDTAGGTELPTTIVVATFVYTAVVGVIVVGKQQLLALRDKAEILSRHDSLTGLANRRALTDLLDQQHLARQRGAGRQQDSLGMLLIDLDDFKEANTLHGLPGGDRVLLATAAALRSLSRENDIVVRLGGDEFAIVASGFNRDGMERLATRAIERVHEACLRLGLSGLEMTASAGWALYPDDTESIQQLVTVADLALRAAKAEGKNRWHPPTGVLHRIAS